MESFKHWLSHPATVRVCQVAIGGLFAVAALAKLGDIHAFAEQVHNFRLLPTATENFVALTLPWIELVAALALLFGFRARSGGAVAALLVAVFTLGVLIAMARGLDIECGCFGTADGTRVGVAKILQNTGMLALALVASVRPRR
jgi:uncharacterized membrane protein YphA (DoxX/SURF4 family)